MERRTVRNTRHCTLRRRRIKGSAAPQPAAMDGGGRRQAKHTCMRIRCAPNLWGYLFQDRRLPHAQGIAKFNMGSFKTFFRKQPLYFLITTAGTDRNSICYEQHQKAEVSLPEGSCRQHQDGFGKVDLTNHISQYLQNLIR